MSIINEEIGNVEIRLMQRRNKSLYFEVRVRSEVKPRVKKVGIFEKMEDGKREAQKIAILAGAMAEELCEQYNDTLDPSNVAKAAVEAYREVLLEQKEFLAGYEAPHEMKKKIVVGANGNIH